MTNDYKELLGEYITGNIEPTSPSKDQILDEINNILRQEFNGFIPNENYTNFMPMDLIQSSTNGNFILYGGYVPEGETALTDSRGFIMILDHNMKPIKTIYEFSSGTRLRPIQKMIQIEDGTFVAVDSTIFALPTATDNIMTNPKRFIMLNNFSSPDYNDDYSVVLRKSYTLPSAYTYIFCIDIVKNPNSSHYILAGKTSTSQGGVYYEGVRIIDLKINVGSSNEWSQKTTASYVPFLYGGINVTFDENDDASFEAIITRTSPNAIVYSWNGTTSVKIIEDDGNITPYVDSVAMRNQVSFIDYDDVYFVVNNQRWSPNVIPRYVGLFKYTYSTGQVKQIYLKNIGDFDYNTSREGIFITSLNGELYLWYCDNYNYSDKTANVNYQRLENDMWQPKLIANNQKYVMEYTMIYSFNIYNVVSSAYISQNFKPTYFNIKMIKEVYNNLNYNSSSYIDYNSLIPHTSVLYDTNNKILFGRNLYNSTSFKNTTTSTVEIPNTMLNGVDIVNKNLLGLTNIVLDQDTNTINKNVYETLYLNFINSINVINKDTGIINLSASTYINSNINSENSDNTTMENSKIAWLRINYEDGTDRITGMGLIRNDDTHYTITATIYIDNEVSTLDIISYDENQIYMTLDISDLEVGNNYTLTQNLRIE